MRIVLFGMKYYNYTSSIKYALESLGHTVLMVLDDGLGINSINIKKNKMKMIGFAPDIFINFCGNYKYNLIDAEFLNSITGKRILMYADAIKFVGDVEQNILLYDKVCVFEPSDINLLKKKYGIDGLISSASVAEEIFCKKYKDVDTFYDLSFVGVMTNERLEFFENIAEYADNNNLKMIVFGHFWHNKHWWQEFFSKRKFAKKYPYLVKFAQNRYIQPEEAALLYKQTKICLNKHIDRHQGMGSRTFEIMGNNNFLLCDERVQAEDYGLIDGKNIVFYKNIKECIEQIEYYLRNDDERERIAANGGVLVRENYTTREVMRRILKEVI